jgi:hypothetical protein
MDWEEKLTKLATEVKNKPNYKESTLALARNGFTRCPIGASSGKIAFEDAPFSDLWASPEDSPTPAQIYFDLNRATHAEGKVAAIRWRVDANAAWVYA